MTFILLFCASALSAFLGWIMEMLGRDYGISGGAWRIIFYIIAALLIVAGIIDGITDFIRIISRKRSGGRSVYPSVTTQGLYPPPKRSGTATPKARLKKQPPRTTGNKGKK